MTDAATTLLVTGALERTPLLHGIDENVLRSVAAGLATRAVAAGETILVQGDPGDEMYILAKGRVRVLAAADGGQALLAVLGPGEVFGEASLLTGAPRSASVVAESDALLSVLDRSALERLVSLAPDVGTRLGEIAEARAAGRALPRFPNEAYVLADLTPATERLTIGSDASNDLVLAAPGIAPFHAEVLRRDGRHVLVDLDPDLGGTYVGREPVHEIPLDEGAELRLGSRRLYVQAGRLMLFEQSLGVQVEAIGLERVVRGGRRILDGINLAIDPGELVAVVGTSGAGKTTLLNMLVGLDWPTAGSVRYDGLPLVQHRGTFRGALAYVPQYDIVHAELTIRESLRFAGRLRLPTDVSRSDIDERIQRLVEVLGLGERLDVAVGRLSGGQRKRVSVAAEMLSEPRALFLDEPTSGLDPGMDEQLMLQFRELADEGRTVVLTTHATRNIRLCDRVIVVHGGRIAFAGSPGQALAYFGVADFADIYHALAAGDTRELAERFEASALALRQAPQGAGTPPPGQRARGRSVGLVASTRLLLWRDLRVLVADRPTMALRLFGAPLLALLQLATFDASIFAFSRADGGDAHLAITLLYLSSAICMFASAFTSANVITREDGIYRRERLLGLSPLPYVASKTLILAAFAALQGALFIAILAIKIDFPGGAGTLGALAGSLALVSFAGAMMGALVSSLSRNVDRAALIVVLLLIPQLVFAGSTVPRSEMSTASRAASDLTVTKWALELAGGLTGIDERLEAQRQITVGSTTVSTPRWPFANAFKVDVAVRWLVLAGFPVAFTAGTLAVQAAKGRPPRGGRGAG